MKVSTLVGCALAASFLSAAPAFALTTTSPNTIAVQRVIFNGSTTEVGGLAAFDVKFRNNGPIAASRIEFSLDMADGGTAVVADVGTFAAGATVDHVLRIPAIGGTGFPNEATTVRVSAVQYADGSSWSAPFQHADWQAPQPPAIPIGAYAL